jgi:hypothetical protein
VNPLSGTHRIYLTLSALCLGGYAWLIWFVWTGSSSVVTVCPLHQVTGLPCPSCGATRSIGALLSGDMVQALWYNPLGLILAAGLVVLPVWLAADLLRERDSLYRFYQRAEATLRRPSVALPLILLILANWAWNIVKSL